VLQSHVCTLDGGEDLTLVRSRTRVFVSSSKRSNRNFVLRHFELTCPSIKNVTVSSLRGRRLKK
jgi:hypothetical protein